uniref:Importin alpha-2 subunit n=1 Tax=Osmerus mordax TaxID=8014 RepID=C1BIX6_OSMMO|nr:Importin alpha-2 subunit [Osmerus mordax]
MPTKNVVDERMTKFKNKGKEPAKLRERRIAECVELRKAHKNENFLKRRNISTLPDDKALSPEYITDNHEAISTAIEDIIGHVNNDTVYRAAQSLIEKYFNDEKDCLKTEATESGFVFHTPEVQKTFEF